MEDRRLCKAKALGSNPSKSIGSITIHNHQVHRASNVAWEGWMRPFPDIGRYEIMYILHIRRSLDKVRWTLVIMLSGGWLGSRADEGRAKLR